MKGKNKERGGKREGGRKDENVLTGEEKKWRRRKKRERGDKRNDLHEYIETERKREKRMRGMEEGWKERRDDATCK